MPVNITHDIPGHAAATAAFLQVHPELQNKGAVPARAPILFPFATTGPSSSEVGSKLPGSGQAAQPGAATPSSGLSTPAIVGLTAGGLFAGSTILWLLLRKKKK